MSDDGPTTGVVRASTTAAIQAGLSQGRETISARQVAVISAVVAMVGGIALAVWVARGDIEASHSEAVNAYHAAEIERLDTTHVAEVSRLELQVNSARADGDARVMEWKELYQEARGDLRRAVDAFREALPSD